MHKTKVLTSDRVKVLIIAANNISAKGEPWTHSTFELTRSPLTFSSRDEKENLASNYGAREGINSRG